MGRLHHSCRGRCKSLVVKVVFRLGSIIGLGELVSNRSAGKIITTPAGIEMIQPVFFISREDKIT